LKEAGGVLTCVCVVGLCAGEEEAEAVPMTEAEEEDAIQKEIRELQVRYHWSMIKAIRFKVEKCGGKWC
jgi:hypothetical protein